MHFNDISLPLIAMVGEDVAYSSVGLLSVGLPGIYAGHYNVITMIKGGFTITFIVSY